MDIRLLTVLYSVLQGNVEWKPFFLKSSQSSEEKEGSFLIRKNRAIGIFFSFFNAIIAHEI